jgi:hypothetical protein
MAGVSLEQLGTEVIQKVRVLMEAEHTKFFAHQGVVGDERQVADNSASLGATRLMAEILDIISSRTGASGQKVEVVLIIPPFAQVAARTIESKG